MYERQLAQLMTRPHVRHAFLGAARYKKLFVSQVNTFSSHAVSIDALARAEDTDMAYMYVHECMSVSVSHLQVVHSQHEALNGLSLDPGRSH